LNKRTLSIEE